MALPRLTKFISTVTCQSSFSYMNIIVAEILFFRSFRSLMSVRISVTTYEPNYVVFGKTRQFCFFHRLKRVQNSRSLLCSFVEVIQSVSGDNSSHIYFEDDSSWSASLDSVLLF